MNDKNLKVLVLGSGGREHTLARICAQSPIVEKVAVAPGNGGMADEFETFGVGVEDNEAIVNLAKDEGIDLVVVGPEVPLCNGAVDALTEAGIAAYGPNQSAARLEGSKAFSKTSSQGKAYPRLNMAISARSARPSNIFPAARCPSWSRRVDWPPAKAY